MKKMRKILVLMLAMVMLLSLSITAFASDPTVTAATGTITVENATYGKTYKAYKIFDATFDATDPSKISYTVPAAKKDLVSTTLFNISTAADKNGNYTVSKKDTATDAQIIEWVSQNYASFDSTGVTGEFNATNDKVLFEDVPFGYYYVTSTLGTAIAVDTNNPDVTIKDKNASAPTVPVKTIVSVDGTAASDLKEADAHVGSVIGFKVTGNATNWTTSGEGNNVTTTQNTVYTFEDTPTNMTIDLTNIVVKVNGAAIESSAYTATIADGKLTVSIPLVDGTGKVLYEAKQENSAYIPIEITYEGVITAAAAEEPATNEIGDDIVIVYTYAFQVAKTDGSAPLPGAQFELWANGTALTFIDNGDGTYTYYKKTGEDDTTTVTTTLDMTTNTTISILGLDNKWSYTLKEITVPAGYNQAEDITVPGSKLTKVTDGMDTSMSSTALYKETVVNNQGVELPSTGGIGTTIFYIVGGVMLLGAAVVLISKKRMHE